MLQVRQQVHSDEMMQRISKRHREYGFDCPATDIDFLLVEYTHGAPVALVEYKFMRAYGTVNVNHPTLRALRMLADGYSNGPLPFYIAYYDDNYAYRIDPLNDAATILFEGKVRMSERAYVKRLYRMRGETIPAHLYETLHKEMPTPIGAA
jgi:hypothetical protein